jgi:hypothetical protein
MSKALLNEEDYVQSRVEWLKLEQKRQGSKTAPSSGACLMRDTQPIHGRLCNCALKHKDLLKVDSLCRIAKSSQLSDTDSYIESRMEGLKQQQKEQNTAAKSCLHILPDASSRADYIQQRVEWLKHQQLLASK